MGVANLILRNKSENSQIPDWLTVKDIGGKDNIVFHCIIFPSMLKHEGSYILPENVPSNEFPKEWDEYSEENNIDLDATMHGMIAQDVKQALDDADVDTFGGWKERKDGRKSAQKTGRKEKAERSGKEKLRNKTKPRSRRFALTWIPVGRLVVVTGRGEALGSAATGRHAIDLGATGTIRYERELVAAGAPCG